MHHICSLRRLVRTPSAVVDVTSNLYFAQLLLAASLHLGCGKKELKRDWTYLCVGSTYRELCKSVSTLFFCSTNFLSCSLGLDACLLHLWDRRSTLPSGHCHINTVSLLLQIFQLLYLFVQLSPDHGLLHFLFELRHTSSFCRACPGRFLHVNASCVQSTSNCSASLYFRSVCCHNAPKAHGILHLTSARPSSPTHCVEATCTSLSGAAPMECTSIRPHLQDSRSP